MNIKKHNFDEEFGFALGDYYRCDDIDPLIEELETLRASNRIRGENIEILKADNSKLIAERDQWMKVVEEAFHDGFNSPNTYNDVVYNNAKEEWEKFKVDYKLTSLPAQQIPEGYALDSERLNFLMQRGARIGWSRDGEKCAVYGNEPDEFNTLIRYNGSKCFDDPIAAIDHAMLMLSASQPKGDV